MLLCLMGQQPLASHDADGADGVPRPNGRARRSPGPAPAGYRYDQPTTPPSPLVCRGVPDSLLAAAGSHPSAGNTRSC